MKIFSEYSNRLQKVLADTDWSSVETLATELLHCWKEGRNVFVFGNGGSAANAIHIANDFLYGVARNEGEGLRVQALSSNAAVMTCLANDEGYEEIYARQLAVLAKEGDIVIALSGSGNSANILKALNISKKMNLKSYAILGYTGGQAKKIADMPIHFEIDDMQISEDLQIITCHMIMQFLYTHRQEVLS